MTLEDRRYVEQLVASIDGRVRRLVAQLVPRTTYGTVVGPADPATRRVSVVLAGSDEPSAGFVYGEVVPLDGDLVRVILSSSGDRFIDAVLGRDLAEQATGYDTLTLLDSVGSADRTLRDDAGRLIVDGTLQAEGDVYVGTTTQSRWLYFPNGGRVQFGAGGTTDAALLRASAGLLRVDNGAGGAADLDVVGELSAASVAASGMVTMGAGLTGSATPTINNGGTATYTGRVCEYVQLGQLVVFRLAFTVSAAGSGATAITVTGTGLPGPATGDRVLGDRGGTGVTPIVARLLTDGTFQTIVTVSAPTTALTGADLASGAGYSLHGAYLAA